MLRIMRIRWLIAALVLSLILATAQQVAVAQYLYWRYEWFDIPMHFFGGITIATFVVALLRSFRPRLYILLFTVAVLGWEVFEYLFGIPREQNYVFDTALDLLMGTLGALITYTLARFTVWRSV